MEPKTVHANPNDIVRVANPPPVGEQWMQCSEITALNTIIACCQLYGEALIIEPSLSDGDNLIYWTASISYEILGGARRTVIEAIVSLAERLPLDPAEQRHTVASPAE